MCWVAPFYTTNTFFLNFGRRHFSMVMLANCLKDVFCSDGSCYLERVIGPRKEVVVAEIVVGMFRMLVLTNLVVLMDAVILVLPMVRGWTWEKVVGVTEEVVL